MSFYTSYSRTKRSSVCYFYKCSKCGAMNHGRILTDASASYNDRGVLTSKGLERRKQASSEHADEQLEKKRDKILSKISRKDYRYLNLNVKCRKCGNQEAWAQPGLVIPKWLDIIRALSMIPVLPPIIFGTWYLFDAYTGINAYLGVGLCVLLFAGLMIVPHLIYRKNYREAEMQFAGLPEASLPHAFKGDDINALAAGKKYYLDHNLAKKEEFDELGEYMKQPAVSVEMLAQVIQGLIPQKKK